MKKHHIDLNEYANDILKALPKGILLTTKAGQKINSMVIGWGTFGVNWSKPVFVTYVREGLNNLTRIRNSPSTCRSAISTARSSPSAAAKADGTWTRSKRPV